MKPYPKKGLPPKKPRRAIAKVSAKKRTEIAQRQELRVELLNERGPKCQARILGLCAGSWSIMHERKLRSQRGSPTDPANVICVCQPCHDWIHTNISAAQSLGLLERQKP